MVNTYVEDAMSDYLGRCLGQTNSALTGPSGSLGNPPLWGPFDNSTVVDLGSNFGLNIYKGVRGDDMALPSLVVSCPNAVEEAEDHGTGNMWADVEVTVAYGVDSSTENPSPVAKGRQVADGVYLLLMRSDLNTQLTPTETFTCQHYRDRQVVSVPTDGRTIAHTIKLSLLVSHKQLG